MNTGVYILYHTYNSEKIYVGSTQKLGFKQRFNNHLRELSQNKHNNNHLQAVSNKYGIENFRFKILQKVVPEYCLEVEQFWIDYLDTVNSGYNQSKKAGVVSMPYEERRIATRQQQKTVYQIDKNNKVINIYQGVNLAGIASGINKTDISFCCNKKAKMAGGYFWCFEEDYSQDTVYISNYNNNGVNQYDKNNILIKKWDSVQEAANFYSKGHNGNITNCARGKLKSCYGYIWKYN